MAKTYEEVINGSINSLKGLKEMIASFKDELATAKEGSQEWENAVDGLAVAQERLDKINKAAKGTLDGYNGSAKDSINTLKARIKELNTERNAMDMNSQEYADATARLKEMNDKLRESGVSAGDMKANVGNYAQSLAAGFAGVKDAVGQASSQMVSAIGGLGQSLGGLSPTLGTLTTGMRGLSAATGAVGLALAAIAAVLAAFKEGVESSEANTNKFKEAMAPLQAILVLLQRAIQDLTGKFLDWMISLRENEKFMKTLHTTAQVLVTVFNVLKSSVEKVAEAFGKMWDKIKEIGAKAAKVLEPVTKVVEKVGKAIGAKLQPVVEKVGNAFKETWDEAGETVDEFGKKIKTTTEEVNDVTSQEIALQQQKRGLLIANAKLNGELAQKDLEIAEEQNKEVKDYDKILGLINEKTQIQMDIARNNVALKQAELAAIKQRNALSDSNTKDLDAEAQAEAALVEATNALTQAEAAGEREKKKIVKAKYAEQRTEATNALNAALKELEAQYNNTLSAIEKPIAPEGAEIDADSINAYHDAMMENYRLEYEAYASMTEQKIAALQAFIDKEREAGRDTAVQEAEISKLRANQAKEYKKMVDSQTADDKARMKALKANYNAQLSAFSGLMDAMSGLFEENTIAYKATATAKALIDTYLAANAVLAEQQGGVIARTVAMAATIAAGIANVIAIWKTDPKNPSVSTNTQRAATSVPSVDNTPYSYSRTVQTVAAEETLNQSQEPTRVYVLESDITDAQNRAKVRVAESSW